MQGESEPTVNGRNGGFSPGMYKSQSYHRQRLFHQRHFTCRYYSVCCRMLTTGKEWLPGRVIIIPLLSFLFFDRVVFTRTIHTFIVLRT
jgi:hypothetical protein